MALEALMYRPNKDLAVTRQGQTIFYGHAGEYQEWLFNLTIAEKSLCDPEDLDYPKERRKLMEKTLSGLRHDARSVAQRLGIEVLMSEEGLDRLKEAMHDFCFPRMRKEATRIYIGCSNKRTDRYPDNVAK